MWGLIETCRRQTRRRGHGEGQSIVDLMGRALCQGGVFRVNQFLVLGQTAVGMLQFFLVVLGLWAVALNVCLSENQQCGCRFLHPFHLQKMSLTSP